MSSIIHSIVPRVCTAIVLVGNMYNLAQQCYNMFMNNVVSATTNKKKKEKDQFSFLSSYSVDIQMQYLTDSNINSFICKNSITMVVKSVLTICFYVFFSFHEKVRIRKKKKNFFSYSYSFLVFLYSGGEYMPSITYSNILFHY